MWNGECFVFDGRVSLKNELKDGTYKLCHACRLPISNKDIYNKYYKPGVSCHNCFNKTSEKRKKTYLKEINKLNLIKKEVIITVLLSSQFLIMNK